MDYSYQFLLSLDLSKYKFLNFISLGTELLLHSDSKFMTYYCRYNRNCPSWDEINCDERTLGRFVIKTPCRPPPGKGDEYPPDDPLRNMVFVKGYKDFLSYLKALQNGEVSQEDHETLFRFLFSREGNWEYVEVYRFSLQEALRNPRTLYVFGENNEAFGKKIKARSTQAVVRIAPNSAPIRTQNSIRHYYSDNDLERNKLWIREDIDMIIRRARSDDYDTVVFPADGVGTGAAKLNSKAPKTWTFLQQQLPRLKGQPKLTLFNHNKNVDTLHFKYDTFTTQELEKARSEVIPEQALWNVMRFCKYPSREYWKILGSSLQTLFRKAAAVVLRGGIGNTDLARKVLTKDFS